MTAFEVRLGEAIRERGGLPDFLWRLVGDFRREIRRAKRRRRSSR